METVGEWFGEWIVVDAPLLQGGEIHEAFLTEQEAIDALQKLKKTGRRYRKYFVQHWDIWHVYPEPERADGQVGVIDCGIWD